MDGNEKMKWAATWATSPSVSRIAPARYARGITLRYALRVMLDGEQLRLHFSNQGGTEPVIISRVSVALCDAMGVLYGAAPLTATFAGAEECHMEAGGRSVSDPLPLAVRRGQDVAVTLYLGEMTQLASGTEISGPLTRMWFCEGNALTAAALPPLHSMALDTCFFLEAADVWTEGRSHTLVCFGDSITAQGWPDELALRVLAQGRDALAVVRRGIGGSRIFHAYDNVQHRCYGRDGLTRFAEEIDLAGADRVIVLHGINDMIHPDGSLFRPWSDLPTAQQMIEGLETYVRKAHDMGMKACLGTCPTFKGWRTYSAKREMLRHEVNDWIRDQAVSDGVADFDAALRDRSDPDLRDPACDCGDHVHPSAEGAARMAACVPEAFLTSEAQMNREEKLRDR